MEPQPRKGKQQSGLGGSERRRRSITRGGRGRRGGMRGELVVGGRPTSEVPTRSVA